MNARSSIFLCAWMAVGTLALGAAERDAAAESEGLRLFSRGDYGRAVTFLEKASSADRHRPDLARALGLCYLRLHNSDGARTAFARLFVVAPESAKARLLTAKMMIGEELEDMAEPELRSAIKLEPR